MTIHAYTSFTFCYLNRARAWARSIKLFHGDWKIWALITDKEPEGFVFNLDEEPFDDVIFSNDLYGENFSQWIFGLDVVEACTAVKGRALKYLLSLDNSELVFYFDPDTYIYNDMNPLKEILKSYSIILTPHQLKNELNSDKIAIMDNEMSSLKHGVFNLGFVGVKNDKDGNEFADWWLNRCDNWCHDRTDIGIFVDQKWCDLVPCYFDNVYIIRDPGYNVASWNIGKRKISFSNKGNILVNNQTLLRFFHFTKLGKVGDAMTARYAKDNIEVYELWHSYKNQVEKNTDLSIPPRYWFYGKYSDGENILKKTRTIYRSNDKIKETFKEPFSQHFLLEKYIEKIN